MSVFDKLQREARAIKAMREAGKMLKTTMDMLDDGDDVKVEVRNATLMLKDAYMKLSARMRAELEVV